MNTFCVLPWFGKEIRWDQKETHCCLLPKSYDVKKIQFEMLNGQKPVECNKCWQLEDNGLQSDRQLKNSALDFYWDRDLAFIKQDAESGVEKTLMLKLLTSFTCNATCVSCNSGSSSSWAQLDRRIDSDIPIRQYTPVNIKDLTNRIDFKELKMLSLIGGEPLYEKKNFELLEYLIGIGNTDVFLSLVTNGSVELTDRQKNILSQFKKVNFCLSIDGIGPVFEYLRFPLLWSDLVNNLKFFREVTDNISVNYTLSNLNVLYHNQTVEWFNKEKLPYANNPVYAPAWLQPKSLPVSVKQLLKQQLSDIDYQTYIGEHHTQEHQTNFEKLLIETAKQDRAKHIELKTYLPELHQLLMQG